MNEGQPVIRRRRDCRRTRAGEGRRGLELCEQRRRSTDLVSDSEVLEDVVGDDGNVEDREHGEEAGDDRPDEAAVGRESAGQAMKRREDGRLHLVVQKVHSEHGPRVVLARERVDLQAGRD